MQMFVSLLTLAAMTGTIGVIVLRIASRRSRRAAEIGGAIESIALWLAFAVAFGATAGSLYFSEIANYTPCRLCWYQRIAVFPLTFTLFAAAVKNDRNVKRYVLPVSVLGIAVSVYHQIIEWYPQLEKTSCSVDAPCTAVWFRGLGFMSLAFMASVTLITVITLVTVRFPTEKN